jgi:hypothetical protein
MADGMTQVTAEPIEGKSWTLRVFKDGDEPGKAPYVALLRVDDLGGGVAKIAATMGELSDSTNIAIALKVIEMGFKVLQFSTLKGHEITHWAELVNTDDTYSHWRVDLDAALVKYMTNRIVL